MAQYAPAPAYYQPPQGGYPPPQGGYAPAEQGAKLMGLELSAALGFALPSGDVFEGSALSDGVGVHFPLILGVGYRMSPLLSLGGVIQYAPGTVKDCDDCTSSDIRIGAEARFHFNAERSFAPILAVGLGYEWLTLNEDATSTNLMLEGVALNLEVGGDIRLAPQIVLTPFLGLHAGQFSSMSLEQGGSSTSADIPDGEQAVHQWLLLGCRGAFTL